MTKRKAPPISDAEEVRIQAMIARDADNPDVTDAEAAQAKPASMVLPPDLLARLSPVDLVLVEGFKRGPHAKIEVYRAAIAHHASR